jgi:hypothetical protein
MHTINATIKDTGEECTVIVGDLDALMQAPGEAYMIVYVTNENGDNVPMNIKKGDVSFDSFGPG